MSKRITVDDVINAAEMGLENENRHSESISRIWEEIVPFVAPGKKLAAAKALADAMEIGWESYLSNEDETD